MRFHSILSSATLMTMSVAAFAARPAALDNTAVQLVSNFSVASTTAVPGKTLKAGSYSIRVVDHLADRVILQVEDAKGQKQSTFLAVEAPTLAGSVSNGPIPWRSGPEHTAALRGYSFLGGTAVEFVYPKEEAVAIAKANASTVPAIDPASEGRVAANKLSKDDMQMVTLWMLSPTRVGPANNSQPAIQAARYQPPTTTQQAAVEPVTAAPSMNASLPSSSPTPVRMRTVKPAPTRQVASLDRPPVLARLPHTASQLPLLLLVGTLFLVMAAGLRSYRAFGYEA